ncbi:unnamed protein product, partial [Ectocarpus sp. 4 AP-2014]
QGERELLEAHTPGAEIPLNERFQTPVGFVVSPPCWKDHTASCRACPAYKTRSSHRRGTGHIDSDDACRAHIFKRPHHHRPTGRRVKATTTHGDHRRSSNG